mgnify:CR=1 FL=1
MFMKNKKSDLLDANLYKLSKLNIKWTQLYQLFYYNMGNTENLGNMENMGNIGSMGKMGN